MPSALRHRRGFGLRQLATLQDLRPILRAPVDPGHMLRSVTRLLAVDVGQYCIADVVDRHGAIRRLDIQHADASLEGRLRLACDDAMFEPKGRVARLLERGGSELAARVTDAFRQSQLADIVLPDDQPARSYMAASVMVNGSPMAVLTLVATRGTRRYDDAERAFLEQLVDWVGLGVENALRREAQPRASVAPLRGDDEAPASRRRAPARRA